jgi:transcription elongation GreA/GreB family factor
MLEMVDKSRLLAEVAGRLRAQLEEVTRAQKVTQAGATHEDNKAEGDKDMRSTEASYIARGQAARVEQLFEEVQQVESVTARGFGDAAPLAWGALVSLETGGNVSHHMLLPAGAGLRLDVAAGNVHLPITIISTRSPLGQALIGAHLGDLVSLDRDDLSREWEIVAVG